MSKTALNFWILFTVSVILSAIIISVFLKALKIILMIVLILALTPIIFMALRLLFPIRKNNSDKLKKRD
ncbi:MAG: hypothetical protein LPK07_07555 [Hymenobacteraceae bacterium]|nr:hypothetical protein [Hymenobacteraceae bacterium]